MDIAGRSAKGRSNTIGKKNILLVLDNLDCDWVKGSINQTDDSIRYYLLTFGFSPEQVFLRYDKLLPNLRQKVALVDTNEISLVAEKEARAYYLELIKELPKQRLSPKHTILDILSYKNRNLWWYLNICEKNIWTDKMIHRLYDLLRLHYTCEGRQYDEVRLYLKDTTLCRVLLELLKKQGIRAAAIETGLEGRKSKNSLVSFFILYFFRICKEIYKNVLKLAILSLAGINFNKNIHPGSIGFFSVYPLWWQNAFSPAATDIFFQNIPGEIEKMENVHHFVWLEPLGGLFKQRRRISAFHKKGNVTILEQMIKFPDLLALFSMQPFLKLLRVLRLSRVPLGEIKNVDISDFVREELFSSSTHPGFVRNLLIDELMKRVQFEKLKALFFRLEFQPFERTLLYNTAGKTKTLGFQHSAFGKNFLNYVFCNGELRGHWKNRQNISSMPLPDYILTSGNLAFEYLAHAGFPSDRLAICGGIRVGKLFEYLKKKRSKHVLRSKYGLPSENKVIFFPTSQIIDETICMLNDLLESVNASNKSLHIIVKSNPNMDHDPKFLSSIIDTLDKGKDNISYEIFNEKIPPYDYITMSDAVLLTGGSMALEAMVLGVVPIIYVCRPRFSHNAMIDYPKAVILVENSESMGKALKSINSEDVVLKLKENWKKPIYEMFGDISEEPNKRFLKILSKINILSNKNCRLNSIKI